MSMNMIIPADSEVVALPAECGSERHASERGTVSVRKEAARSPRKDAGRIGAAL